MKTIAQKAWRLLNAAQNVAKAYDAKHGTWVVSSRVDEIDLHCDDTGAYADQSEGRDVVVASGNWNTIDKYDRATNTRVDVSTLPKRLGDAFEKLGIPCEWSDQTSTCDGCGKLIRTDPDSYSWTPQYVISDGGIECAECVDHASHLETLHGQLDDHVPSWIDPLAHGYTLHGEDMSRHEATMMFADLKNAGVWSCIVQYYNAYDHRVYILEADVARLAHTGTSTGHLLSIMGLLGACDPATAWVCAQGDDACQVVRDSLEENDSWVTWLWREVGPKASERTQAIANIHPWPEWLHTLEQVINAEEGEAS